MRKLLFFLLISLVTCAAFADKTEIRGFVKVAHGYAVQPDGTRKDLTGMVLPYRAWPIEARKMTRADSFTRQLRSDFRFTPVADGGGQEGGPEADVTVYNADATNGYGYVEFNPSSLDDVTMTNTGVSKPWRTLTFGFHYVEPPFENFLIRWRVWTSNVENPPGTNDFENEVADFGVIWNQPVNPGTYAVEIDVSVAGVNVPQTSFFMAQQFRDASNQQGEGFFKAGIVENVFNPELPPFVGSSQNQFWLDYDPMDGKYENSEVDVLESGQSNHLLVIKVSESGTVETAFPLSATVSIGTHAGGDVFSTWFSLDNNTLNALPNVNGARQTPVIQYVMEGLVPSASITSISVVGRSLTTSPTVQQKLELWHYLTSQWVTVDTRDVTSTGTTFSGTYGGLLPLSGFVNIQNRVRARVSVFDTSTTGSRSWQFKLDQFNWRIGRP